MAIEIYSKSNIGEIVHFGYFDYEELVPIRKISEKFHLSCLQFLPYGGDIIFNSEQANHIFKNEVPLLKTDMSLSHKELEALNLIATAALSVSKRTHTFLIFEGD